MSGASADKRPVKLISAEGFEFVVDHDAACVSNTIKNMLSSQGAGGGGGGGGPLAACCWRCKVLCRCACPLHAPHSYQLLPLNGPAPPPTPPCSPSPRTHRRHVYRDGAGRDPLPGDLHPRAGGRLQILLLQGKAAGRGWSGSAHGRSVRKSSRRCLRATSVVGRAAGHRALLSLPAFKRRSLSHTPVPRPCSCGTPTRPARTSPSLRWPRRWRWSC